MRIILSLLLVLLVVVGVAGQQKAEPPKIERVEVPAKLPAPKAAPALNGNEAQRSGVAQLIEVRNVFSSLYSMKALYRHHAPDSPIRLEAIRVEPLTVGRYSDSPGRAAIDFRNMHPTKTIHSTDWRIDVYDQRRRTLVDTFYVGRPERAAPGKKAGVGAEMGNFRMPYEPAALAQILKITYTDGSVWEPGETCRANDDISRIVREPKSR
jgi:hypothetical protein